MTHTNYKEATANVNVSDLPAALKASHNYTLKYLHLYGKSERIKSVIDLHISKMQPYLSVKSESKHGHRTLEQLKGELKSQKSDLARYKRKSDLAQQNGEWDDFEEWRKSVRQTEIEIKEIQTLLKLKNKSEPKSPKKLTAKDKVLAAQQELKAMKTHTELRNWAISQGMDNRAAFPQFKKALLTIGIDYNDVRAGIYKEKSDNLEKSVTHKVCLYTDYKSSANRYAVTDCNGDPLWYGKDFDGPLEQSKGELETAKKAIWLAGKIKEQNGLSTIGLHLKVDAQWLIYWQSGKNKAWPLKAAAEKYNVLLNVEWIPGSENPADKYTVGSGYANWKDSNVKDLAQPVDSFKENNDYEQTVEANVKPQINGKQKEIDEKEEFVNAYVNTNLKYKMRWSKLPPRWYLDTENWLEVQKELALIGYTALVENEIKLEKGITRVYFKVEKINAGIQNNPTRKADRSKFNKPLSSLKKRKADRTTNTPAVSEDEKKAAGKEVISSIAKGQKINSERKASSQKRDNARTSKRVKAPTEQNIEQWKKDPGALDIAGVDAPIEATVTVHVKRDRSFIAFLRDWMG